MILKLLINISNKVLGKEETKKIIDETIEEFKEEHR